MRSLSYLILFVLVFRIATGQEDSFSCANDMNNYLERLIGEWRVETYDRLSPNNYERNAGLSVIRTSIEGCGIQESYRGTYKNRPYAREVIFMGKDSIQLEMSVVDSEHGSFSILKGNSRDGQLELYWFRNEEVKNCSQNTYLAGKPRINLNSRLTCQQTMAKPGHSRISANISESKNNYYG